MVQLMYCPLAGLGLFCRPPHPPLLPPPPPPPPPQLQDQHTADAEAELRALLPGRGEDWVFVWSCSGPPARKGYSGVLVALDGARLELGGMRVTKGIGLAEADAEGRSITVRLPGGDGVGDGGSGGLVLSNHYVPNSGDKLQRLGFREREWDAALTRHLADEVEGGGVGAGGAALCCADFNVAVEDIDFFNPHEKRMAKQVGGRPTPPPHPTAISPHQCNTAPPRHRATAARFSTHLPPPTTRDPPLHHNFRRAPPPRSARHSGVY